MFGMRRSTLIPALCDRVNECKGDLSPVDSNEPRMQRERKWYACARNDSKAVSFGRGTTPLAH